MLKTSIFLQKSFGECLLLSKRNSIETNSIVFLVLLIFISYNAQAQSQEYTLKKQRLLSEASPFDDELNSQNGDRIVYRDNEILAFNANKPQAPVHVIIIAKRRIATLNDLELSDSLLVAKMIFSAIKIAKEKGIAESGYRLVFNTNEDAGQSAFHIHLHLLGGMKTGPMVDQSWRNTTGRKRNLDN